MLSKTRNTDFFSRLKGFKVASGFMSIYKSKLTTLFEIGLGRGF